MPLDNKDELFYWVDESDTELGHISRHEAHDGSMKIHRTVAILVFNQNNELLLQQRSLQKDLDPGQWTISAGGHVTFGENYDEAATKELREELGLNASIKFLEKVFIETPEQKEYVQLYKVEIDNTQKFNFDKDEIQTVKWIPLDKLQAFVESEPFSYWAKIALEKLDYLQ